MRSESNEQGRDSLALQCNNNMLVKGEEITLPLNICPSETKIQGCWLTGQKIRCDRSPPKTSCFFRLARTTSSIIMTLHHSVENCNSEYFTSSVKQ